MKIKHAIRKNKLPDMLQKLPILAITKHAAEIVNKIQPIKFIWLSLIMELI